MSCVGDTCGVGGWGGPKPGDPSNNGVLSAKPAVGGIDLSWTYPTTNAYAVAHAIVYRSISNLFINAIQIATWNGDQYFDRVETGVQYWYWIQFVSINGTVLEPIGPATASAYSSVEQIIQDLTGKIDDGVLSQALRAQIASITTLGNDLLEEVQNRFGADSALALAVQQLQNDVDGAFTVLQEEVVRRTEGDSALVDAMSIMGAKVGSNAAAIIEEATTRANADEALSTKITTLESQIGLGEFAAYKTWEFQNSIDEWNLYNYWFTPSIDVLDMTSNAAYPGLYSPILNVRGSQCTRIRMRILRKTAGAWNGTIFYKTSSHDYSWDFAKTIQDSTKIGEWVILEWDMTKLTYGVQDWYNSTIESIRINLTDAASVGFQIDWIAIGTVAPAVSTATVKEESIARTAADQALASNINTVQSTLNGSIAQVEQNMTTNINALSGVVSSLYTVKLTNNGLIGGYGLYNSGILVEAGFDVDRFWVGRTNADKKKPFIIENDIVYMDAAFIRTLEVSKITSGESNAEWRIRGQNGRIVMDNGAVMKVIGTGFGASGDLISWFGPSMPIWQCSKANATTYEALDGSAYWGGALRAGVLYNAQQTTQIDPTAQVHVGPFWSNGNPRSVVVSYSFSWFMQHTPYDSARYVYDGGATYADIHIFKSFNNGPEQYVTALHVDGDYQIMNESDGPDSADIFMGGSTTFTDVGPAGNYKYRAVIVGRSTANIGHTSNDGSASGGNVGQSLGIISTEQ